MKTMNYSIIRCICALVLGVLLVAWPEAAILYLVITIGATRSVLCLWLSYSWKAEWNVFSYSRIG